MELRAYECGNEEVISFRYMLISAIPAIMPSVFHGNSAKRSEVSQLSQRSVQRKGKCKANATSKSIARYMIHRRQSTSFRPSFPPSVAEAEEGF